MSILFYAKSAKSSKDGLTPIYLRVTIDGQRIELSTSKFVEKSKWNPDAGKVKGLTEEARSINSYLDILKNKVYEVEKDMVNNDIEITAQTFKNRYLGIDENQRNLIAIFEEHNRRVRELIGKEYAENTYKRFVTALSHTKDFLRQEYKRVDISITKIDTAFINDFDFYLRNTRNCNNNSTLKYIRNFGKIVK
ncbi:phage integrase SAM-like domain-containing protein [Flavobacterium sp. TBRC 19031]|uniref:phage integrase SAM-like domain-containing protein n=1 Tax=Flavobacterium mekongense TaxID=3379707 RepID=UPI003999B4C2